MNEKRLAVMEPDDGPPDLKKLLEKVKRELRPVEDRPRVRDNTPMALTEDDKRWFVAQLEALETKLLAAFQLTPAQRSAIARKAGLAGGRGRKKAE